MYLKTAINILLLGTMCTLASCLGGDDEDFSDYGQSAVTSMTFQTLTYLDGKTFAGAPYTISIDQINRRIYCPDSLPVNTDLSKITVSVGTSNAANVAMLMGDSVAKSMTSADTLDLTVPRTVRCVSLNNQSYIDYTMTLAVHKEYSNTFSWSTAVSCPALLGLSKVKVFALGSNIYAMGQKDGSTVLCTTAADNPYGWSTLSTTFTLSQNAQAVCDGKQFYVLDGATLYTLDASGTWTTVSLTATPANLLGAYDGTLYAVTADKRIIATADNGTTWTDEQQNDDFRFLPDGNIASCIAKVATYDGMYRIVTAGSNGGNESVIWSRLFDNEDPTVTEQWMYCPYTSYSTYRLPELKDISLAAYDKYVFAVGDATDKMYVSRDNGLTWATDEIITLPTDYSSANGSTAICSDSNNLLWLISGKTGNVWRGRINSCTWANAQHYFK